MVATTTLRGNMAQGICQTRVGQSVGPTSPTRISKSRRGVTFVCNVAITLKNHPPWDVIADIAVIRSTKGSRWRQLWKYSERLVERGLGLGERNGRDYRAPL